MFYVIRYYEKIDCVWELKVDRYEDIDCACEAVKYIEALTGFEFISMRKVG